MSKKIAIRILIAFLLLLLAGGSLNAQNLPRVIGGGAGQLRITLSDNGLFNVERESYPGSGIWNIQLFEPTPLFALTIDNVLYLSAIHRMARPYTTLPYNLLTPGNDIVNVVGTRNEYGKNFRGTYNGEPFSVVTTIIYDTSNPDFFVLSTEIDSRSITGTPVIKLAYGYDAYVNNNDFGVAWIMPDPIPTYNGTYPLRIVHFSQVEVRSLQLVGSINADPPGSFMGFFPMGRAFDKAYSASPYTHGYASVLIKQTNPTYINRFEFGPLTDEGGDNAVAVCFENIPSGGRTTISTGLTFTQSLDGTLDYLWDGVKDKTIAIGSTATLNLAYTSLSLIPITGIAFQANFPGLKIVGGGCGMFGFTSGTGTCTVGNSYYAFTDGIIDPQELGYIDVPIQATQYGQWVVSASSITNTAKTIPTGTPATLTASTEVNIAAISETSICPGSSSTITVKLDGTTTTSQPITIAIDYTGSTATASDYSARPTTVTIPANENSATFTIVSTATAVNGRTFNFRLASTDKAFATIGSNSVGVATVRLKPTLNSTLTPAAVCSGSAFDYTATSATAGTSFSWARTAVTGISNAAASDNGANINETLVNTTNAAIDVTYVFTLTAGGCSSKQNVVVSVNPLPTLSSTLTPAAVCTGSSFDYTAASGTSGVSYSWVRAAVTGISNAATSGSGANISEVLVNTTTAPVTVTYAITLDDGSCTNIQNVVVIINPLPTLNSPLTATVCSGSTFSYTATSPTSGVSFSWSQAAVAGISSVSGTGSGLTLNETLTNSTTAPINVTYIITLTAGSCISTQNVVITVLAPLTLNSSLTPAAACSGSTFGYTATSATSGTSFSWTRAAVAGISNVAASSSTASISETLVNTTNAPINVTYVFTLTAGSCSSKQNVVVSVNPLPTLNSTLTPAAVCSGSTFSYTATSAVSGVSFGWTRAAVTGISNAAANGSGTTISEALVNTTNAPINVTYVIALAIGSCSNTQNVTVSINPLPTLTSTLIPTAVCSGSTFSYTATSAVSGVSFSWVRAAVAGISNAAASGSGASISETLINTTNAPIAVTYIITVMDASCGNTQSMTVNVNPLPTLSSTLTPAAVCSGNTFSYTAASVASSISYSWSRAAVVGISNAAANGNGATITETLVNTTNAPVDVTYAIMLDDGSCTNTQNIVVSVKPLPTLNSTLVTTVCSGSTFNYTATSDSGGISYSWTRASVAGISNAAVSDSGATINETLVNTTTAPIDVTYVVTLTAGSCTNIQNVIVSVNPLLTLSSTLTPVAVCSGSTFDYTATSTISGVSFSWMRAAVAGISNAAASGSGAAISETPVNTTNTAIAVTYAITLNAEGCTNTQNVTVSILPSPTLSSTLTPSAVCSGSSFGYTATGTASGISFSWVRAAITGISNAAANGSGATITEVLVNTTNAPITVTYTITLTDGTCSNAQNVTVSVIPPPTLSSTLATTVCSGSTFSYTAASAAGGINFSWTRAAVAGISNAAVSGSGATINETLVNTTTAPINVTYVINLSAGVGCTNTQTVTVSVKPIPILTSTLTPVAICSGSTFYYTPISSLSNTTYTWARPAIIGISNDACSGHTEVNDEKLINTTSLSVEATYTITLTANGCSSTQGITTSIKPSPKLDFNASGKLVCYNNNPTIELSNLNNIYTYSIYDESENNKLATIHGVSAEAVTLNLQQQKNTTYYVEVTDDAGCSSSSMASVKLSTVSLAISPSTLPLYVRGEEYNQLLTTNGVNPLFSIVDGQLPVGLSLNPSGQLHGQVPLGDVTGFGQPFSVQVIDVNGCVAVQDYTMEQELFAPELFSPNGDGINDHFMKGYRVVIFDRLGVKLFEGNDGWDGTYKGKVVPNDTYFYILFATAEDGKELRKVGHIIIFKR